MTSRHEAREEARNPCNRPTRDRSRYRKHRPPRHDRQPSRTSPRRRRSPGPSIAAQYSSGKLGAAPRRRCFPSGSSREDRPDDAGARRQLDDPDQLAEGGFERCIADCELEHLGVRQSQGLISPVVGNVVALDEDAAFPGNPASWKTKIEEQLRRSQIGAHDGHRQSVRRRTTWPDRPTPLRISSTP